MNWISFPKNLPATQDFLDIVNVFKNVESQINSSPDKKMESNEVLECVRPGLESIGYTVEKSKQNNDKIYVPVLFGENGTVLKHFEADAYHKEKHIVIEVEAGRAVTNYQFLKDYFEACMMQNVDFLCIAVRMKYRTSNDYEKVKTFFETLFLSQRITTELKGILIIGY